jgi:hypothetical protein
VLALQELFKKVVPHHCLGSVWGRRDKKGCNEAPSVQATVEQFNRVSLRVIATVLKQRELKTSSRAKILLKWIHIAQVMMMMMMTMVMMMMMTMTMTTTTTSTTVMMMTTTIVTTTMAMIMMTNSICIVHF